MDAPLTREEIQSDEDFFKEFNAPFVASEDELDDRQRAFLQARGVIDGDPSG